jgi:hypothetical protein
MKRFVMGDVIWLAVFAGVTLFFVVPATHQIFVSLTASQPYLMGFAKFAVLATMGELLAIRLSTGAWKQPLGMIYKILVWGGVGMAVTFMFTFYSSGVAALADKGLLPAGAGLLGAFLKAFYTSLIMNVTFGPVFMAVHRVSDTAIDLWVQGGRPTGKLVVAAINWPDFMGFVVGQTIPFWWIPVHTLTFMLPSEYRVLAAAYLSIVLGIILAYARRRKAEPKG